jgi:hypothetical protein
LGLGDGALGGGGGGTAAGRRPTASSLMLGAMAAEKALDRLAERIVGAGTR